MVRARGSLWFAVPLAVGDAARRWLLRILALLGLFLLPMQVRAGIAEPHPHALLQLILDVRDGSFDHHVAAHHEVVPAEAHAEHAADHESSRPDIPTFEDSAVAAGGLVVLTVLPTALLLIALGAQPIWPCLTRWRAHVPALEPPPPRYGLA